MTVAQIMVAGRYLLHHSLGSGGMGRVWLARDEVLRRDVAIKEVALPFGLTDEEREELRLRTMREARAAARLSHPNVVQIYDVVRSEEQPWIVMEYVPSRSLHHVVNDNGPLGVREVAVIGLAMLSALEAAHRSNVLHRDVKPSNVLIAEDGRIVLTDFGLATMDEGEGAVTQTGLILGSPQYISPERAQTGTSTRESDLWSLGATLYAAVEGRAPYSRPTALGTLVALATARPDPMRRAGDLKPVLAGLLRRDPRARITVGEARWLLWQVARGEAVARIPRPRRGRRSMASAAADADTPNHDEITPRLAELARQSTARAQLGTGALTAEGRAAAGRALAGGTAVGTASVPSGVTSSVPSGVTSSVPSGVTSSVPSGVTSSVPSGVTSSVPSGVTSSVPSGVTPSVPSGVTSSVPSGVTSSVPVEGQERRGARRWLAAGTAAAAFAAVAAVALGTDLLHGPTKPAARQGDVAALAAQPPSHATLAAPSTPTPSPGTVDPGALPAGWSWYSHAIGFQVPVPTGWTTVQANDTSTLFCAPGGPPVLQVGLWKPSDPVPVMALQREESEAKLPDYHRIRIEALPQASGAEWEYTFQDPKMGQLHGLDRVFVVAGQPYLVQWRTSPNDWLGNRSQFQLITSSFRPIRRPAIAFT